MEESNSVVEINLRIQKICHNDKIQYQIGSNIDKSKYIVYQKDVVLEKVGLITNSALQEIIGKEFGFK